MLKRSKTDSSSRRRGSNRVLVVDDNADAATLVGRILRRAGFEVAEAGEYQLALATIANEPELGAVVVAFSIAGSGASLKLLDAVRNHANPDLREMPLILMTDHSRQLLFAWQAEADEVLVRPVHERRLAEAVREVLKRDDAGRAAYRSAQIEALSDPGYSSRGPAKPVFS